MAKVKFNADDEVYCLSPREVWYSQYREARTLYRHAEGPWDFEYAGEMMDRLLGGEPSWTFSAQMHSRINGRKPGWFTREQIADRKAFIAGLSYVDDLPF